MAKRIIRKSTPIEELQRLLVRGWILPHGTGLSLRQQKEIKVIQKWLRTGPGVDRKVHDITITVILICPSGY